MVIINAGASSKRHRGQLFIVVLRFLRQTFIVRGMSVVMQRSVDLL